MRAWWFRHGQEVRIFKGDHHGIRVGHQGQALGGALQQPLHPAGMRVMALGQRARLPELPIAWQPQLVGATLGGRRQPASVRLPRVGSAGAWGGAPPPLTWPGAGP